MGVIEQESGHWGGGKWGYRRGLHKYDIDFHLAYNWGGSVLKKVPLGSFPWLLENKQTKKNHKQT